MPKEGFEAVTLKDEDLALVDRIAKSFDIETSRPAVIRAALHAYADKLGVEA